MKPIVTIIVALFLSFISYARTCDSLRVETIKGQKFIIHKVGKNETLADLVKRYKVTAADLQKHNELKQNKVVKNQLVRIPFVSVEPKPMLGSQPDSTKVDEAHANAQAQETQKIYTHQVVTGETVFSIAKKYKITAAQLGKWNNLRSNKIVLGQILIVDESATAKPFYKLNGVEAQMPQQTSTPKLATADLIQQIGIAFVDESMQVLHADAPIGTIVKVTNLDNGKQCLVRVTGQLDTNRFKSFIISIGNEAQEKLGSTSATIRIKLEYAIKP